MLVKFEYYRRGLQAYQIFEDGKPSESLNTNNTSSLFKIVEKKILKIFQLYKNSHFFETEKNVWKWNKRGFILIDSNERKVVGLKDIIFEINDDFEIEWTSIDELLQTDLKL